MNILNRINEVANFTASILKHEAKEFIHFGKHLFQKGFKKTLKDNTYLVSKVALKTFLILGNILKTHAIKQTVCPPGDFFLKSRCLTPFNHAINIVGSIGIVIGFYGTITIIYLANKKITKIYSNAYLHKKACEDPKYRADRINAQEHAILFKESVQHGKYFSMKQLENGYDIDKVMSEKFKVNL